MNQVIESFSRWFNNKKTVHEFLNGNGRTPFRLKKAIDFHKNMIAKIGRQPRPSTNAMKNNNLIDLFAKFKSYDQI